MKVRKQEAAHYLVESESRPGEWFACDLLAWETFGSCTCEQFTIRLLPMLREGRELINGPCKHLLAARNAFTDDALRRMLDLMKQQNR